MKFLPICTIVFLLLSSWLLAQDEYATVITVSADATYNDFNNIYVTVSASAGYYWFFVAVENFR